MFSPYIIEREMFSCLERKFQTYLEMQRDRHFASTCGLSDSL